MQVIETLDSKEEPCVLMHYVLRMYPQALLCDTLYAMIIKIELINFEKKLTVMQMRKEPNKIISNIIHLEEAIFCEK